MKTGRSQATASEVAPAVLEYGGADLPKSSRYLGRSNGDPAMSWMRSEKRPDLKSSRVHNHL
eukprot:1686893-Karenia_brevis.AAC.1